METQFEISNNVHLEKLLMSDPEMEKRVQGLVKQVLREARKKITSAIHSDSSIMKSDPRQAYRAVRHSIYKRLLGGQVNILRKKRAGARGSVGTSRRGQSQRTEDIMSYKGADRGFILRFLEKGTDDRQVAHLNNQGIQRTTRTGNRDYKGEIGNRGHISGRNFFGRLSNEAMAEAAQQLEMLIDEVLQKEFQG